MSAASEITSEDLTARWNDLFDAHPWLDGLESSCGSVTCCPDGDVDWVVLSQASGLLFLATGQTGVNRLSRDLLPDIAAS